MTLSILENKMRLEEMYELFIEEGVEADPRGVGVVKLDLLKRKEKYDVLSPKEQESYDVESLKNPYYDSRILYGDKNTEVKNVMVGIDIESSEIVLARQLINSGTKIDLIVAHHPEGYAYSTFYAILGMQIDILNKQGVPINIAEKIVSKKLREVQKSVFSQNSERVYDAAKLLNIPLVIAHSVADNHAATFLQSKIDVSAPVYLKDIVLILNKHPEYQHSLKIAHAPFISNGNDYSRCGKVFVDMTGGTEGPIESFKKLEVAGVGTIVTMCLSSEGIREAKEYHINVVSAGHIASDNLGLNLLFDKLEKKLGVLKFIECSGFRRFRR
jgi:putative NIF3 family GTP cyclohydrolase 1 type 2